MAFAAIHKSSAPEMVAAQILERIKSGALAPGSRLPAQRDLAEQLGVGRSSLREAINALVVMGYLAVRHGSGSYVRRDLPAVAASVQQLSAAFEAVGLLELMEAREVLECKSAALAAERADKGQIDRLREILARVEATADDYRIFLGADIEFHTALAEATGNAVICEMTKLVLDKVVRQHQRLRTDKLSGAYRRESIRTARQVVAAVAAGDAAQAGQWMQRHLQAIRTELKEIVG